MGNEPSRVSWSIRAYRSAIRRGLKYSTLFLGCHVLARRGAIPLRADALDRQGFARPGRRGAIDLFSNDREDSERTAPTDWPPRMRNGHPGAFGRPPDGIPRSTNAEVESCREPWT